MEKPLVATVEQGLRLLDEAARRHRILMVDHTFVYTSAVRKMKEIVSSGLLGPVYYYDSVRVNLSRGMKLLRERLRGEGRHA